MVVSLNSQNIKRRKISRASRPVAIRKAELNKKDYSTENKQQRDEKEQTKSVPHLLILFAALICVLLLGMVNPSAVSSTSNSLISQLELPTNYTADTVMYKYMFPQAETSQPVEHPDSDMMDKLTFSSHTIASGDTISGIAQKYGVSLDTVITSNNIQNVKRLKLGTELRIPNMNGVLHRVSRGENLSRIARKYGVKLTTILDTNNMESEVLQPGMQLFIPEAKMANYDMRKVLGELFIYPTTGRFTSGYGYRSDPFTGRRLFHNGIDLANSMGTKIVASMEGSVIAVGVNSTYGKYVIMKHPDGYQTWYAHLQKSLVSVGDYLQSGQKLGLMGSTGYSTGPHLHFSVFRYGKHLDPLTVLN